MNRLLKLESFFSDAKNPIKRIVVLCIWLVPIYISMMLGFSFGKGLLFVLGFVLGCAITYVVVHGIIVLMIVKREEI